MFSKYQQKSESQKLVLKSKLIPAKGIVTHLGVCLTPSLQWSAHVRMVTEKTGYKVFALKRLAHRGDGSNDFIKRLYLIIVRPALEHGCAVWNCCLKSDIAALERVQLSFARTILRLPRRSFSNESVLQTINWPTLAWRRGRYQLLLFWRLHHGEDPPCSSYCSLLLLSSQSSLFGFRCLLFCA